MFYVPNPSQDDSGNNVDADADAKSERKSCVAEYEYVSLICLYSLATKRTLMQVCFV